MSAFSTPLKISFLFYSIARISDHSQELLFLNKTPYPWYGMIPRADLGKVVGTGKHALGENKDLYR